MKWLLSLGMEPRLKASALERHVLGRGGRFLDLACGTGEVLGWLSKHTSPRSLVGVDITPQMLDRIPAWIDAGLVRADINRLPFEADTFDVITAAYGLRYAEPRAFLHDCRTMLRSGGRLFIFDLGNPSFRPVRALWHAILLAIVTPLGVLLHGKPRTYWHLVETLRSMPTTAEISELMKDVGFEGVQTQRVMGGLMVVYVGDKI